MVILDYFILFLIFALIRCETMTDRKKEPLDSKPTTPVLVRIYVDTCRLRSSKVAKYVQLTVTDKCI